MFLVLTRLAAALVSCKQPSSCLSTTAGEVGGWAGSQRDYRSHEGRGASRRAWESINTALSQLHSSRKCMRWAYLKALEWGGVLPTCWLPDQRLSQVPRSTGGYQQRVL